MAKCLIIFSVLVVSTFAGLPRSVRINPNGSWRVIGGSDAPDGAYPHQISLRKYTIHACGGSILNELWVLTAAHCVERGLSPTWSIVAGSNQLHSGGDSYKIEKVIIHPQYDDWLIHNDIALIKLAEPIVFNKKVQPIACETEDVGGQEDCILCGWGVSSARVNDLQHINLLTTSVEECQKAHSRPVVDKQICTLTKAGEGACQGDSGGGLIRITEGSERRLIGIVSWGTPCARGDPDVYTRVSSYADWINENCGDCAKAN